MPVKDAEQVLRPSAAPKVYDDISSLREDLTKFLSSIPSSFKEKNIHYDQKTWTGGEILEAYDKLLVFLKSYPKQEALQKHLEDHFVFFEPYGNKDWGDVFITGYFEPYYHGSLLKKKNFSSPALKTPKDLVKVDLKAFADTHPQLSPHLDYILKEDKGPRLLTGRLNGNTVVPYSARKDLAKNYDPKNALVWLDPIDLFFLQIQGSGTIRLENGNEITIGYDSQNGHQYVAIGKFLTHAIPLEEMTADKIENYLREQPEDVRNEIMNQNPSYVFFSKRTGRPTTSMGTEVIDNRTIASDSHYFEKGLIGYIDFPHPENEESIKKFVFNQDSGGAIKGTGRVDFFWGKGKEAGRIAGRMKHNGRLWFLLPKKINSPQ